MSGPPPPSAGGTPAGQPATLNRLQMQLHLRGLQSSTSDLRGQLQQLRKLQVPPLPSQSPSTFPDPSGTPPPPLSPSAPSSHAAHVSSSKTLLFLGVHASSPSPLLPSLTALLETRFTPRSPSPCRDPSRPHEPGVCGTTALPPGPLCFLSPSRDSLPCPAWQMAPPVGSLASLCPLLDGAPGRVR